MIEDTLQEKGIYSVRLLYTYFTVLGCLDLNCMVTVLGVTQTHPRLEFILEYILL